MTSDHFCASMNALQAASGAKRPLSCSEGRLKGLVSTDKDKYLAALTEELEEPGKGKLDAYLKPFIRKSSEMKDMAGAIKAAPGLDGGEADAVAGETSDPALKAQYEAQEVKRKGVTGSARKG